MGHGDFDGTIVLERLATIGKVDEFLEAVDSDDFAAATRFMRAAGVDEETVAAVLEQMRDV